MHKYVEAIRLWVAERKNYHGRILTQGSGEKNGRRISRGSLHYYRMAGSEGGRNGVFCCAGG
jgi:hypothetical protein